MVKELPARGGEAGVHEQRLGRTEEEGVDR
jgi:hypothetical protein